jgi:hypothetical protein
MTTDEILTGYIDKMGEDLGSLFYALSNELTWMHWRWDQFRILFGERESRIELLNQSAPFFFHIVQGALFEETLLGIARVVGPVKSRGNPNLTIMRLPPLCDAKVPDVHRLVEEVRTASAFATDWRHRHIAHRDLNLALGKSARMLEVATREKVERSLSSLRSALNRIESVYCDSVTAYFSTSQWDAKTLLYIIRDGLLREKDRQERWNRGELHEDNISPPGPI